MNFSDFPGSFCKIGLIGICTWSLFWLLCGALFSHPNAEDLSLALYPRDIGIFPSIKHNMATYDGRYFINFMHAINPLMFNWINGYKWIIIFSITAFTFSLYFFFSSILSSKKIHLILLSVLFTSIHFAVVPSIIHQLYWMVSSFVYLYVWIFGLLFAGALFRAYNSRLTGGSGFWLFFSALLLFCTIGINEMFLPFLAVFLCLLIYLSFPTPFFKDVLFIAAIGFISMLFFIASPGITERIANERYAHEINYPDIIYRSLSHQFYYLVSCFTNPILLTSFFLCGLFSKYFTLNKSVISLFQQKNIFNLALLSIVMSYLMTLTYYIPLGHQDEYPDRIFNTINVLIMLAVFFTIIYYSRLISDLITSNMLIRVTAVILLAVFFIYTDNNIGKLRDEFQNGAMKSYHREMKQRYAILTHLNKTDSCYKVATINKLSVIPSTIAYSIDITPNREAHHWNTAYESYFNIDQIRLVNDTIIFR